MEDDHPSLPPSAPILLRFIYTTGHCHDTLSLEELQFLLETSSKPSAQLLVQLFDRYPTALDFVLRSKSWKPVALPAAKLIVNACPEILTVRDLQGLGTCVLDRFIPREFAGDLASPLASECNLSFFTVLTELYSCSLAPDEFLRVLQYEQLHGKTTLLKMCGIASLCSEMPEPKPICHEQLKCLEYLVTLEPSLALARDDYGNTAAHCAAASGDVTALAAIHQLDPSLLLEVNPMSGSTPFITAALHLQVHALKYIHSLSPEAAEAKGRYGRTAFAELCNTATIFDESMTKRALGMLIKMNPAVGMMQDDHGNAPIHLAALQGSAHLVSALLLRFPKSVDLRNDNGETALAIAASMKHAHLVKLFVCSAPHVTAIPDIAGKLPMHRAEGCIQCSGLLLRSNAPMRTNRTNVNIVATLN